MKYLLLVILVWFVLTRLMRFRIVVQRGNFGPPRQPARPEGSVHVERGNRGSKQNDSNKNGEYVDYEEVN